MIMKWLWILEISGDGQESIWFFNYNLQIFSSNLKLEVQANKTYVWFPVQCSNWFCVFKEIRDAVEDLEGNLESLPKLVESLNAVKQETIQHSQLGTATDNLKHLFTVPESVRQTEIMMEQGQLLEAHQALAELENSR